MLETDVEIVFFTDDKRKKAVQLYVHEKPVLILGSQASSLHGFILERFLKERSLRYSTQIGLCSEEEIPALAGEEYRVVGMGEANLYPIEKLYTGMASWSRDYNIGIDAEHNGLVKETLQRKGWKCI